MKKVKPIMILAALAVTGSASAAISITNGDFEDTANTLTDWNAVDGSIVGTSLKRPDGAEPADLVRLLSQQMN